LQPPKNDAGIYAILKQKCKYLFHVKIAEKEEFLKLAECGHRFLGEIPMEKYN
jgi:hypothetical protein